MLRARLPFRYRPFGFTFDLHNSDRPLWGWSSKTRWRSRFKMGVRESSNLKTASSPRICSRRERDLTARSAVTGRVRWTRHPRDILSRRFKKIASILAFAHLLHAICPTREPRLYGRLIRSFYAGRQLYARLEQAASRGPSLQRLPHGAAKRST
ncbi:hypothetical protein MES4922_10284 [Mesorhizobium ventifaucium]|uniref:Uncharacterized protein n=1 Tax=Mesorhizobium ventifaucium TaxID=666020 RepID=A0ABM9DCW3_9HYPH|nr:hypothetical protein MES4922_10284 [Mesorhizobium ventifaucium]